jgi:hypothetical protein
VGVPPAWGLGGGLTIPTVKVSVCCETLYTASEQDGLFGTAQVPENGYDYVQNSGTNLIFVVRIQGTSGKVTEFVLPIRKVPGSNLCNLNRMFMVSLFPLGKC